MGEIKAFVPVRQKVTLTGPQDLSGTQFRIMLDPDDEIDELYELNNAIGI